MENITFIDTIINKKTNYDENTDAIVPDMLPDIADIIGVSAMAFVKDTSVSNDRILISGDVKCEVCYVPENSDVPVKMNVSMSFAHIVDTCADQLEIFADVFVNNITANVINPRKISLLANLSLGVKAYKKSLINLQSENIENLQVLSSFNEVSLVDSVNFNDFTIMDNVEFKGIIDEKYSLYSVRPCISISDTKILKNKIMVRGNVDFVAGCVTSNDFSTINCSVPFSEIFDIKISDEKLDTNMKIAIKNFDFEQISDFGYSFSISAKCLTTQVKKHNIDVVLDIYDEMNEIDIIKSENGFVHTPVGQKKKSEFTVSINSSTTVDAICHAECEMIYMTNLSGDFDVFAHVFGVYKSDGKYHKFSVKHTVDTGVVASEITFDNTIVSISASCEIKICTDMAIFNDKKTSVLVVKDVVKTAPKTRICDTVIFKYISSDTRIWDIAKQYNTTVVDIINANEIDTNATSVSDKMLLIPVK